MRSIASAILLFVFAFPSVPGQALKRSDAAASPPSSTAKTHWEGGLPLKSTRTIEFDTDEGTQMSVDVSPDGKTVVFDLLGDLYSVPLDRGGEATRLTSGIAIDMYPRFSPDGTRIAFVSDRSGIGNIWTIRPDGSDARTVTKLTNLREFGLGQGGLNWSHDGKELLAMAIAPDFRFLRFDARSGGLVSEIGRLANIKVPGRFLPWRNAVVFDPDREHVWISIGGHDYGSLIKQNIATGGTQEYQKDKGQAMRASVSMPTISPDGKLIAYKASRLNKGETLDELRVRDHSSSVPLDGGRVVGHCDGQEINVFFQQQIGFTPDSKSIVCSSEGKLKLWDVATGKGTDIPFRASRETGAGAAERASGCGPVGFRED